MPDAADPSTQSPAAVADPISSAASAPQPAPSSLPPSAMFRFEDAISDVNVPDGPVDESVSNGGTDQPVVEAAAATDDKPAPPEGSGEGVSSSDTPEPGSEADPAADPARPLSRREQERVDHLAKIAELEAQVAERDPEKIKADLREEVRAEIAQQAEAQAAAQTTAVEAERYRRLLETPDADLSGEDYQWREERKALLRQFPQAEAHYRAMADEYVAKAREIDQANIARDQDAFKAELHAQLDAAADLPGVNKADLSTSAEKPLTTWDQLAGYYHAAGAAWKEAELKAAVEAANAEAERLRNENGDLRARALGETPAPAVLGRSTGGTNGVATIDPSKGWRGNLADAL